MEITLATLSIGECEFEVTHQSGVCENYLFPPLDNAVDYSGLEENNVELFKRKRSLSHLQLLAGYEMHMNK